MYKATIEVTYRPHMPLYDLIGDLHYDCTFRLAPMDEMSTQIITKEIAQETPAQAAVEAAQLMRSLRARLGPDYTITLRDVQLIYDPAEREQHAVSTRTTETTNR